jgi:protein phosphatase
MALAWAQRRIQEMGKKSADLARMGTTLTLAYLDWPTAYIAHVGDSRAYLYGHQELLQLTDDQTVAQMLADAGAIEPEEVERHTFRNMLGSLLCCEASQLHPRSYQRRLMPGDQLLLCTDGLTRHVPAGRIAEILDSAYSAADACQELVAAANAAGGADNTTVVLASFGRRLAEITEDAAIGRDASTVFWLNKTRFS